MTIMNEDDDDRSPSSTIKLNLKLSRNYSSRRDKL